MILKKGTADDFVKVYEYDLTKLRDICGEFEYVKTDPKLSASFAADSEERENVYDWIIYLKKTLEPVGNVVTDHEVKELNGTELAFNMHPSHWGNGYMKEAVIEIMRFLFENGYDNVISGYDEGNKKSKRVNEKIGFEFYRDEENSWQKNEVPITKHVMIMSKERFNELYDNRVIKRK